MRERVLYETFEFLFWPKIGKRGEKTGKKKRARGREIERARLHDLIRKIDMNFSLMLKRKEIIFIFTSFKSKNVSYNLII